MLAEKKPLGVEELEAQTALELPDRELLRLQIIRQGGAGLIVANVALQDVNVGVQACGVLNAGDNITCEQTQD